MSGVGHFPVCRSRVGHFMTYTKSLQPRGESGHSAFVGHVGRSYSPSGDLTYMTYIDQLTEKPP